MIEGHLEDCVYIRSFEGFPIVHGSIGFNLS